MRRHDLPERLKPYTMRPPAPQAGLLEAARAAIAPASWQTCRDCGASFRFDPDADRCPACVRESLGE